MCKMYSMYGDYWVVRNSGVVYVMLKSSKMWWEVRTASAKTIESNGVLIGKNVAMAVGSIDHS